MVKTAEFLLGGEEIETKDEKEMDKENNDDGSGETGKSVGLSVPKPLSSDSTFLLWVSLCVFFRALAFLNISKALKIQYFKDGLQKYNDLLSE